MDITTAAYEEILQYSDKLEDEFALKSPGSIENSGVANIAHNARVCDVASFSWSTGAGPTCPVFRVNNGYTI